MTDEESGSRRPGFVQTLREGWKPGGRRAKTNSSLPEDSTEDTRSKATKATAAGTESEATETTSTQPAATKTAGTKSAAATAAAASTPPAPNMDERMEGLQGWMAEIERKQRRMTFFGAAAVVLAVAAAAGALFLAITTPNSASKDDFDDLEAEVKTLQEQVSQATTDQTRLKALNLSIQSLEARIAAGEQKANQTASEIATLKRQVAQAAATPTPAPATPVPAPAPAPVKPGSKP